MRSVGATATSCVLIPMYETTNNLAELGTSVMTNLPSMSVIVPTCVPFTRTEAPMTGNPSSSEITVPVTLCVWAEAHMMPTTRHINSRDNFLFILLVFQMG